MSMFRRVCVIALVATLGVLVITGCESGDSDSGASVDVSGTWRGSSVGEDPANSDPDITMVLTQSGSDIAGTVDGVAVSGSVSGSNISATLQGGEGDVITMSGTVDGNTMSGTWVSTTGESGTWTATRS